MYAVQMHRTGNDLRPGAGDDGTVSGRRLLTVLSLRLPGQRRRMRHLRMRGTTCVRTSQLRRQALRLRLRAGRQWLPDVRVCAGETGLPAHHVHDVLRARLPEGRGRMRRVRMRRRRRGVQSDQLRHGLRARLPARRQRMRGL